jgi:uncharacterized membrane protein YsdA (DUF1294 family)/cold shock CspA family protein
MNHPTLARGTGIVTANETLTGRITSWERAKGYGFVQVHGGPRVFLHVRDFAERHKAPDVGDVILFTLGANHNGRSCATRAVHANDGGRWRLSHLIWLLTLLALPAAAVTLAGRPGFVYGMGGYAALSLFTFLAYWWDKRSARSGEWRTPEATLHLLELFGGWPGALLAQRRLRHKCSKRGYQAVFWCIVSLHQYLALDFLLEWRIADAVRVLVRGL